MILTSSFWKKLPEMSRFMKDVRSFVQPLDFEFEPVAVTFTDKAHEEGDSTQKLRFCKALDVVRREHVIINFSKESCACVLGRHFLGLEILPVETIADHMMNAKAYESRDIAITSVREQPQPVQRGKFVVLGPITKMPHPDVVLLFVNAEQANRILGLTSFRGITPFTYYPVSKFCSILPNVLAKGKPEINFLTENARRHAAWSPNEFMIALPFETFVAAVNNFSNSGFGATS
jgi:uncharacterized protein (DUF169 family)